MSHACCYFKLNEPEPKVPSVFCTSIQSALSAGRVAGDCTWACELEPCECTRIFTDPTPDSSPIHKRIADVGPPEVSTSDTSSIAFGAIDPLTLISKVMPATIRVCVFCEVESFLISGEFSSTVAVGATSFVGEFC